MPVYSPQIGFRVTELNAEFGKLSMLFAIERVVKDGAARHLDAPIVYVYVGRAPGLVGTAVYRRELAKRVSAALPP